MAATVPITLTVHVGVNDSEPINIGYVTVDFVPSQKAIVEAFTGALERLEKRDEG